MSQYAEVTFVCFFFFFSPGNVFLMPVNILPLLHIQVATFDVCNDIICIFILCDSDGRISFTWIEERE